MKRTKEEIMCDFIGLATALSPENLHLDGEASAEQVKNSLSNINQVWTKLETEIGYSVTEDDVWKYSSEKRKQKASDVTNTEVVEKNTTVIPETTTTKKKNFFGV